MFSDTDSLEKFLYIPPMYEDSRDREIKKLKRKLEEANKVVALPERYIINKGATILFWKDGKKTIVRRCEDDTFNPRLAFLTAFFQNYCGMSKNKANKYLANLEIEDDKKLKNEKNLVTVIDVGETYSTYDSFIASYFPQYINNFKIDSHPVLNKKYKLIGTRPHEIFRKEVALIQDKDSKQVFIIGVAGIKEDKLDGEN